MFVTYRKGPYEIWSSTHNILFISAYKSIDNFFYCKLLGKTGGYHRFESPKICWMPSNPLFPFLTAKFTESPIFFGGGKQKSWDFSGFLIFDFVGNHFQPFFSEDFKGGWISKNYIHLKALAAPKSRLQLQNPPFFKFQLKLSLCRVQISNPILASARTQPTPNLGKNWLAASWTFRPTFDVGIGSDPCDGVFGTWDSLKMQELTVQVQFHVIFLQNVIQQSIRNSIESAS